MSRPESARLAAGAMRRSIRPSRAAAGGLLLATTLMALACGGDAQPAQFDLFRRPANTIGIEMHELVDRGPDTIMAGPLGMEVPVDVTWRTGLDDQNCARIEEINIKRTGGSEEVILEIPTPRGGLAGCKGTGKPEEMVLEVKWRYRDQSGVVPFTLRGDGRVR